MRREDTMNAGGVSRRALVSSLVLGPIGGIVPLSHARAEPSTRALPAIVQPSAATPAAFLERAHALRDAAAAAGDQPYGAVVVRDGRIVGEGQSRVVRQTDPTAHSELMAVRDAARRLGTRDLSDCDVYSSATPCPMCQAAIYWGRVRRIYTEGAREGVTPRLGC
jgi:tRNA(Arg) A34 adenosine deaminase TadA